MKDPLGDAPPVDSRRAILGVSVAIALFVVLIFVRPSMAMTIAIAIGLIVTIMLHEAGHLIGAKHGGMKATEFFVGFGPRLWSFRRGETEYGIKAIPAGGYVRVIGMTNLEEVEPEDEDRTYRAAPYKRKMVMILAGVTVNLLLAYLFTFAILVGRGQDSVSTRIGSVSAESPAQIAGMKPGDRLLSIGGVEISDWDAVAPLVRAAAGKPTEIEIERDGVTRTLIATPEVIDGVVRIGITASIETNRVPVITAVGRSATVIVSGAGQTVTALGDIISPSGVSKYTKTVTSPGAKGSFTEDERPRSVIGIVADGGSLVGNDFWGLLGLLAAINVFLALFNLIPLLPFDGGHAVVATFEAAASKIRGKRVVIDQRHLFPVTAVVIFMLLMLGLSTMYLDLRSIVSGT
ncbi:MAG: RIP metalloprotease [Acidimicrobiia bacterium]|nr:RIP metalloprotease [Acidimicrobiia bacterium]MBJ7381794.1 RIP metalloprotease [Acidimicrobiia bacterium]MBJ7513736.1 RIP metalloprotease [Acidimicrobiia bacterium]